MKAQTEPLEHASVRQYCKLVRVPAIANSFVSLAEQAVKENQSHIRYLEALLQVESEERDRHAIDNRTRDAQLPRMKTLEEFDFTQSPQIPAVKIRELAEGGYIERSEPVVLIGECGTGKSHLATGLCVEACPEDAIRMDTGILELGAYSRAELFLDREFLLSDKPELTTHEQYPGELEGVAVRRVNLLKLAKGHGKPS